LSLLAVLLFMVSGAFAQIRLGPSSRAVLQPAPVTLSAGNPAAQPSELGSPEAFAVAAPIGVATTTNLFAQVAVGGGYTTVFTFMNTGADATTGNLVLTGDDGKPLSATINGSQGSSAAINVPPGGIQFVTATDPGATVKTGWGAVLSSGGSLGGVATFQLAGGSGLSTLVGVLSAASTNVATIPVDDDGTLGSQSRFTGYAVANPGSTPLSIKLVLVDPNGNPVQTITPTALNPLPAGQHAAGFLFQDLNNPSIQFRGSVVMIEQTGQQFSVVALVLNQGLLTAIPVLPTKPPTIN
jgi:hypothetical protein